METSYGHGGRETRQDQKITNQSDSTQCFTNFSPLRYTTDYTPTSTTSLTRQESEKIQTTDHLVTQDSTNDEYDQDRSISFDDDEDSTASEEDDSEDWI